jgi:hypothetical protein
MCGFAKRGVTPCFGPMEAISGVGKDSIAPQFLRANRVQVNALVVGKIGVLGQPDKIRPGGPPTPI